MVVLVIAVDLHMLDVVTMEVLVWVVVLLMLDVVTGTARRLHRKYTRSVGLLIVGEGVCRGGRRGRGREGRREGRRAGRRVGCEAGMAIALRPTINLRRRRAKKRERRW